MKIQGSKIKKHNNDSSEIAEKSANGPKVTIAMPCFNGENNLAITIDSFLSQTYPFIEIFIANDGSTDKSLDVIKKYAESHKNIHYLDLPRGNASKTRNLILQNAKGYDFLCWCDCGDQLLPNAILTLVNAAKQKQANGIMKIIALPLKEVKYPNGKSEILKQESLGSGLGALKSHLTFLNPFCLHLGGLISREAISAVLKNTPPMYEENQQNGPDFLAGTKLLAQETEIVVIQEVLSVYNIEEETGELGSIENKVSARYPDFLNGMKNHEFYFDSFVKNDDFKRNAIGTHFLRRAYLLEQAGNIALAKDAYSRAFTFTPWVERVYELANICENNKQVVRLYEIFDSSKSEFIKIIFFNTFLVLHKKVTILRRLLTHTEYEDSLISKAIQLVNQYEMELMFDLGASIGFYAAILTKHTKLKKVHAYEPTPSHFDLLCRTIKANNFENVIIAHQEGVAEYTEQMPLAVSTNFGGANRLIRNGIIGQSIDLPEIHGTNTSVHFDEIKMIQLVSLDERHSVKNKKIYLKIDIEGAEFEAIKGAKNLLKNNQCILQIEVAPSQQEKMTTFLSEINFEFLETINRDMFFCSRKLLSKIV